MTSPTENARARLDTGRRETNQFAAAAYASGRDLQLACLTARAVIEINSKLDDLLVLAQQQVDLLRRLVEHGVKR
jgi:hypothetical protein